MDSGPPEQLSEVPTSPHSAKLWLMEEKNAASR